MASGVVSDETTDILIIDGNFVAMARTKKLYSSLLLLNNMRKKNKKLDIFTELIPNMARDKSIVKNIWNNTENNKKTSQSH